MIKFETVKNNIGSFRKNTVKPAVSRVLKNSAKLKDEFIKNDKLKKAAIGAGIGLSVVGGLLLIYKTIIRKIESEFAHIKRKAGNFDISHDENFQYEEDGLQNITLKAGGKKISAWDINPNGSKQYAVCCLGFGCPKDHPDAIESYKRLIDEGYGVMAFDYLGWGESEGDKLSEKGTVKSVEAVFKYLHKKGIEDKDISLIGHSLGCGVAADYAKKHKVQKLVLINPFNKLNYALRGKVDDVPAPKIVKKAVKKVPGDMIPLKNKFDNEKALQRVQNPTLILHSADDETIPVELAQRLYHKAEKNQNVEYVELQEGGHLLTDEKIDTVLEFLSA